MGRLLRQRRGQVAVTLDLAATLDVIIVGAMIDDSRAVQARTDGTLRRLNEAESLAAHSRASQMRGDGMVHVTSTTAGTVRVVLWRFRRDRRAATAVEFGLVLVPFLGLLAAIIETGLVFLNSTGLEAAVQDTARNIMTGEAQGASVPDATTLLTKYMCMSSGRILPANMSCSDMIVDVRTASNFTSADMSSGFYKSTYTRQFCMGGPKDIVVVRIAYPMPVFLPILAGFTAIAPVTGGLVNDVPGYPGYRHLLVGTAVFKNEPYPAATYSKPSSCS